MFVDFYFLIYRVSWYLYWTGRRRGRKMRLKVLIELKIIKIVIEINWKKINGNIEIRTSQIIRINVKLWFIRFGR